MHAVSSFLAQLVVPLNLSIALLVMAVALFLLRQRKTALTTAILGIAWSVFWSLPAASLWIGGGLEQRYPYRSPEQLPPAQAIVVLGGNTANNRDNWFEPYDSLTARSRVDAAAALYHADKAPVVIVSGAALEGNVSEARIMSSALRQHQVPEQAILLEDSSDTTRENGFYTVQLLREHELSHVLLVTSALHMPRAMAVFRRLGVNATPAPVRPQIVRPRRPDYSIWMPDLRALNASRSIIKEYAGLLVYWMRGWTA